MLGNISRNMGMNNTPNIIRYTSQSATAKPMKYLAKRFWSYIGCRLSAILRSLRNSRKSANEDIIVGYLFLVYVKVRQR